MLELIRQVSQFLYEQRLGQSIRLTELYAALPGHDDGEVGDVLHRMREQRLIIATFQNDSIRLGPEGRDAWNDGSIGELTLGIEYVGERYGPATVHIIVTGADGENAGSGFFSADYPNWIVTAAHVLLERDILRIANSQQEIIARPPFEKILPVEGLDLALVKCDCPPGVNPIRIEWRRDVLRPMDRLLVLGYPAYPNLQPALDHITAELRQVTTDFRGERDHIVISSGTLPGSSGGPVLSRRGRAIGVVEQENIAERLGAPPVRAFTATPALYLAELLVPAARGA